MDTQTDSTNSVDIATERLMNTTLFDEPGEEPVEAPEPEQAEPEVIEEVEEVAEDEVQEDSDTTE